MPYHSMPCCCLITPLDTPCHTPLMFMLNVVSAKACFDQNIWTWTRFFLYLSRKKETKQRQNRDKTEKDRWWWLLLMIVVDDERRLYKIKKLSRLKFTKFLKSNFLFSLCFWFFIKSFSKSRQERVEGWGGVMQEHESPKKKLLTRIQSIFQSLKVSQFLSYKNAFFFTKIFQILWGWGGGRVGEGWWWNKSLKTNLNSRSRSE